MKIYFIRHGLGHHNIEQPNNVNWNIKYPKLTDIGIKQSINVRNKINIDDIDLVIVSPLTRTLQTAENIFNKNKSNKNIIALEYVREYVKNPCDFKEPVEEQIKKYPYINFDNVCNSTNMNNIESVDDLNLRINLFYDWLKNRIEKNIAVVTHGAFLENLIKFDKFNVDKKTWFDNCEVRIGMIHK